MRIQICTILRSGYETVPMKNETFHTDYMTIDWERKKFAEKVSNEKPITIYKNKTSAIPLERLTLKDMSENITENMITSVNIVYTRNGPKTNKKMSTNSKRFMEQDRAMTRGPAE